MYEVAGGGSVEKGSSKWLSDGEGRAAYPHVAPDSSSLTRAALKSPRQMVCPPHSLVVLSCASTAAVLVLISARKGEKAVLAREHGRCLIGRLRPASRSQPEPSSLAAASNECLSLPTLQPSLTEDR